MSELHKIRKAGALIQNGVQLGGGQIIPGENVEHGALAGQRINARTCDGIQRSLIVALTDEKALHADHTASHHRGFKKACYLQNHIPPGAGDGESDLVSDTQPEHGHQRGGNVYFSRPDICGHWLVAGQIIGEKAVAFTFRLIEDELPLAVRLLPQGGVICEY